MKLRLPKGMSKAINAAVAQKVAEELAARAGQQGEATGQKGQKLQLPDVRKAMGIRLKSLWMNHPMHSGKVSAQVREEMSKAASALATVFGEGGSLLSQEYADYIIPLLRDNTVLLQAGVKTDVFTNKKNIGRINGGAVAEYVPEGSSPTVAKLETGLLILEGHKLMAIHEPSNDMLRDPSVDITSTLTDDLMQAIGVKTDQMGFIGDGTGANPRGLVKQIHSDNKVAGVVITTANLPAVIRFLDSMVQKVRASKLPFQGNKPHWAMSSKLESAFKSLRDNAGWVYRQEMESSDTLCGKPYHVTDSFGDSYLFFGLANKYVFGVDRKAGGGAGSLIIDMSQPHFAEDLTMIKAITYNDWKLEYDKAYAYSDDITYS